MTQLELDLDMVVAYQSIDSLYSEIKSRLDAIVVTNAEASAEWGRLLLYSGYLWRQRWAAFKSVAAETAWLNRRWRAGESV